MATVDGTKISVSTLQHMKSVVIAIQSFGVTTAKPMYTINARSTVITISNSYVHMWIICPLQCLLSYTSTSSINFGFILSHCIV